MSKRMVVLAAVIVIVLALFIDRVGNTPAAIVVSAAGAILAVVIERQREVEAAQHQRKTDAYHEFTNLLFVGIVAPISEARAKGQQFKPSRDAEAKIAALSGKVVLAANPQVLKRYCDFLDETMTGDSAVPSRKIFDDLADLMRIFRREMGYSDGKLSNADLYPLFGVPRENIRALPEARPKLVRGTVDHAGRVSPLPSPTASNTASTDGSGTA